MELRIQCNSIIFCNNKPKLDEVSTSVCPHAPIMAVSSYKHVDNIATRSNV